MGRFSRRQILIGTGGVLAAAGAAGYWATRKEEVPIGFKVSEQELEDARVFLKIHPAIDAHAHPGRTFVRGAENLSMKIKLYAMLGTFEKDTIADMKAGGLSAASFAAVSDFQTLALTENSIQSVRTFDTGEAWESYKRQIGNLAALSKSEMVYPVLTASDFAAARKADKIGAFLTVEGGDFLEGKAERVAEAHKDGVRAITLMHYRNNELGDIITGEPHHGGLSAAGKQVVKAMNDSDLLIDVSHASETTALGMIEASSKPVMASHVHINNERLTHPRFISTDLAKAVAETGGGLLGAWPAGIGITSLKGYIDHTIELIEAVGIDHVCMGTDMDANYQPVFDTYTKLPHYVAGLRGRGLSDGDVAKLIGGNFLRLFEGT